MSLSAALSFWNCHSLRGSLRVVTQHFTPKRLDTYLEELLQRVIIPGPLEPYSSVLQYIYILKPCGKKFMLTPVCHT